MKNDSKRPSAARGFGLIELMVAMTIGLIMLLAVSYFFLGSQQSSKSHDDSSRMQENARNALDAMGRAIRQAGYRSFADIGITLPWTPITGTASTITVNFEAQDGGETDCTGAAVADGVKLQYSFSVVNGELVCSNGTTTAVIAENVESLALTYGVDANRDGVIESYATPADFTQVAVVKVVLTMKGSNANAATTGSGSADGYLRQTYSASYTLRNQAG
ncbi:MAG: PilW family protein [Bacteroidota bacterium]